MKYAGVFAAILFILATISVSVSSYFIFHSNLATISILISWVLSSLAVLIVWSIHESRVARKNRVRIRYDGIPDMTINKNHIEINHNNLILCIMHNGIVDTSEVKQKYDMAVNVDVNAIIVEVLKDKGFIETLQGESVDVKMLKVDGLTVDGNVLQIGFEFSSKNIPWGFEVAYSDGKIQGIEYFH